MLGKRVIEACSPLIAVLLGFIAGGLIMVLAGFDPIQGYAALFYGGFKGVFQGNLSRVGNVLLQTTPLLFSGLAAAFAFRSGVFNIGVAGQMYFGGFVAVLIGATLELPRFLHLPAALLGGAVGGMLWVLLPALLKVRLRVNEVVSTILMNYIALEAVTYLVRTLIPGPLETQSAVIRETSSLRVDWLSTLFSGSAVNLGLLLGLGTCAVFGFLFKRTVFGYEVTTVGLNPEAGKYAGMNIGGISLFSLLISGGIAGLGGTAYYLGHTNFIQLGGLPSYGFTGIAVALLGGNTALGVLLASLLFGYLQIGGSYLTVVSDIPNEIVSTIISAIIYLSAVAPAAKVLFDRVGTRRPRRV